MSCYFKLRHYPKNVYVRLEDVEAHVPLEVLETINRYTLHLGHETNEAGIAELRDADGMNVEPDGSCWKNDA